MKGWGWKKKGFICEVAKSTPGEQCWIQAFTVCSNIFVAISCGCATHHQPFEDDCYDDT